MLLFFSATLVASQPNSSQLLDLEGHYHALVIGNANYSDPKKLWQPLETALSDAQEVADTLTSTYGFKVTLLKDANRGDIINSFIKLQQSVRPDDHVLIYYAGHGHLDEDKVSYWIPVDAKGSDISSYLHQSVIVTEVKRIAKKAKHTLVIADSCFSGDLLRPSRGSRGLNFIPSMYAVPSDDDSISQPLVQRMTSSNLNYYQKVADDKSVQVLTAGGNEFVDDKYGDSGHSPFTYFLLKKLKDNKQKFVTASQLAEEVKPLVGNNALQIPQDGVLFNAGDEGGEFVFSHSQIAALNLDLPESIAVPKPVKQSIQITEPQPHKKVQKGKDKKVAWYKNPWVWAGIATSGLAAAYVLNSGSEESSGPAIPE